MWQIGDISDARISPAIGLGRWMEAGFGGACLIVWAIAEGRSCPAGVDRWLMGETLLPAPIPPTARPLM